MKHYFITAKIDARVEMEEHPRSAFTGDADVRYTLESARKEYIKRLKVLSNELVECIKYLEYEDAKDYISPVLLQSQHGVSNSEIDVIFKRNEIEELLNGESHD